MAVASAPRRGSVLLPDPEKRARKYTIISVDDHLIEPPDLFEGRLPGKFTDRAPRVIQTDDGGEAWLFEDTLLPNVGFNAVAGRKRGDEETEEPLRFDEMRASAYDVHERIRDMDLDGVYAQLCFPSFLGGFGGVRLNRLSKDPELALALVRAWNDWHIEAWVGSYPDRLIPLQMTWLHDPKVAAEEIRRNAERGFKAVTFPESPHQAGLPTLHSGYWDPFVAACAETETVICVHTGSSGSLPETAADAPRDVTSALFGAGYSLATTVDWLFSRYAVRHPELKVAISEGGIGWVPSLLDRLDHHYEKQGDRRKVWKDTSLSASEVLQRNFWFCLVDEPSAMVQLDRIGVDNVCFETDFPHADSPWPDSQAVADKHFRDLPAETVRKLTWENASTLFRHPVPQSVQDDPESF